MPMENYEEQRRLFEEWAGRHGLVLESEPLADSKFYKSKPTRIAWAAWQAALGRVTLPVPSGVFNTIAEAVSARRPTDLKFRCKSCGRSSDVVPLHLSCPFCVNALSQNAGGFQ